MKSLKMASFFGEPKAKTSSAVKIDCTLENTNKLLLLATKVYPDAVVDIARGIRISLKSE